MGRREYRSVNSKIQTIRALSIPDARSKATSPLQSEAFAVVPATNAIAEGTLPTEVRDLFGQYEEISLHECWLGHRALLESARLPGYIKVGGDGGFEELLVLPGNGTLFLSHPVDTLGANPEHIPGACAGAGRWAALR